MSNSKMVSNLTNYLRRLARNRSDHYVCADDIHTYLNNTGRRMNSNKTLSLVRTVLNENSNTFMASGTISSNREAARGRRITRWLVV